MFLISAWVGSAEDEVRFEERVPLLFLAEHLRRRGWNEPFQVVFLDGFSRLSTAYVRSLRASGFDVIDFSRDCLQLTRRFSSLSDLSTYKRLCFLRWPAVARYLSLEKIGRQVLHFDGDVVFNVSPNRIGLEVEAETLVLQDCPAFVSVSDYDWFATYEEELEKFARDMEGYAREARRERARWEESERGGWSGLWWDGVFGHDQQFLSFLVHSGRIIQSCPNGVLRRSELYYVENPLYFNSHAEEQLGKTMGLEFSSHDRVCSVEGRDIAFWHFQGDFTAYVNAGIVLDGLGLRARVPNHLGGRGSRLWSWALRRLRPMSRRSIYESLTELSPVGDGLLSFTDILSRQFYWQRGVFSNDRPIRNRARRG